jgi:predicted SAM-dependent methyltransferase
MTPYRLNERFATIDQLMDAFGRNSLKLDLGCGYVKPNGYIGIDNMVGAAAQVENKENAPDILMDLCRGSFPFEDSSITEVRSSHFLEHSILDHIINESYRVLKPAGRFDFTVPYANSAEGLYPGHTIFLTEKWFHRNMNFRNRFEIIKETYLPSEEWRMAKPFSALIPFKLARTFLFNACSEMRMICLSKKQ